MFGSIRRWGIGLGITIITFLVIVGNVQADDNCSYKEQALLNKEANNISIKSEIAYKELNENYEILVDKVIDENGNDITNTFNAYHGYYFSLYITNLTPNFRIELNQELVNEDGNLTKDLDSSAVKDGLIHLYTLDLSKKTELVVTIYSNGEKCTNKVLKVKKINIPKYNQYSETDICKDHQELKICEPFYYTEKNEMEFVKMFQSYIKKDNQSKAKKTFWQSLGSFLKKYIWIIIFPIIVGGILVVINIIIRKKRKV